MEYTVQKQPHSGNNVKIHYEEEESKMEEDNEEFDRENDEYYDKTAPNTTGKKISRKFTNDVSPGLNSEEQQNLEDYYADHLDEDYDNDGSSQGDEADDEQPEQKQEGEAL